jgi:hypothetical protein
MMGPTQQLQSNLFYTSFDFDERKRYKTLNKWDFK